MKITSVEPILLKGDDIYRDSDTGDEAVDNGDWQMLVKVTTDEGITGWSDVETLSTAASAVIRGQKMGMLGFHTISDIIVGHDPWDTDVLWDRMYIGTVYHGRRGLTLHAMSAVDNALWSIKAQAAGVPLCKLLGGRKRDRIMAYASTLFRSTPQAMFDAGKHYVEQGFQAVKFGWGVFGQDEKLDRELVAAGREALGPDRHLLIDPGWFGAGWKDPYTLRSRRQNERLVTWLAEYNAGWCEDFIHPENFDEYAAVREMSPTPIAAGEQMTTIWDFERLINNGCVDVVQPDLTRCGGLTVARRVADLAIRRNIDLVCHCWLTDLLTASSMHLMATLPRARFIEFNVAQSRLNHGVCGGQLKLEEDGYVNIPDTPGIGVTVDEDFVEAHRFKG